jgi:hypothetical protein
MESNASFRIDTWPIPPVHRVDVKFEAVGKSPGQLVVALFSTTVVVRVDSFTDERYDQALSHEIL